MSEQDPRLAFDLGQPVRVASDPSGRVGRLVAVMLEAPYRGLVRWRNAEPTLEALEDLVEAVAVPQLDPDPPHDEASNRTGWPVGTVR